MRKIYLLICAAMALFSNGQVWAQIGSATPEEAKSFYLKNSRSGKYVADTDGTGKLDQVATPGETAQWKFITVNEEDNTYKIYNTSKGKYLIEANSSTYADNEEDATTWHLIFGGTANIGTFAVSKTATGAGNGDAWDDQDSNSKIGYWNNNDGGTHFVLVPVDDNGATDALAFAKKIYQGAVTVWQADTEHQKEEFGYLQSSKFSEMSSAITDASAATTAQFETAISNISKKVNVGYAIAKDGIYYVECPLFFNTTGTHMNMYANSTNVRYKQFEQKNRYFMWEIKISDGNIYMVNLGTGTGVSGIGTMAATGDGNPVDFYTTGYNGKVFINMASMLSGNRYFHANGHSNGNNTSDQSIVGWSSGDACEWTFTVVPTEDLEDFLTPYKAVVEEVNNKYTELSAVAGASLFLPTAASVEAIKTLLDSYAKDPVSADEAIERQNALEAAVNAVVYNMPKNGGMYRMSNSRTDVDNNATKYMSAAAGHKVGYISDAQATRTIWRFTQVAGKTNVYTIQNVLTNEYIRQQTANNTAVPMGTSSIEYAVKVAPNNYGKGVMYAASANDGKSLHMGNTSAREVFVWSADGAASQWTLTEVAEGDLTTAMTAEKALAASEYATASTVTGVPTSALGIILGITSAPTEAPENATLNDYLDADRLIYKAASNNVYRIKGAGASSLSGSVLGVYDNKAKGVPAAEITNLNGNIEYLWQLRSIENGFKLVHLNRSVAGLDACLAAVASGEGAKTNFTTVENGGLYVIEKYNEEGVVRFRQANTTGNNDYINMDGGNGGYLNHWGGNNSQFSIEKVDNLEIALNNAGDGNYWASAFLPFGVSAGEGVELLVGSQINTNTITMATTDNVAAKNGFVIKGTGTTATLTIDHAATATSVIGGSTVATTVDDANRTSIFVFGKKSGENKIGFYNLAANGTIVANKAFIDESSAGVNGFVLDFGDETTAIEGVEVNTAANGAIYDLSGRRVQKATKGIFIVNGKKVIR